MTKDWWGEPSRTPETAPSWVISAIERLTAPPPVSGCLRSIGDTGMSSPPGPFFPWRERPSDVRKLVRSE